MHKKALAELEKSIDLLHREAVGVVSDHWEQVLAMEKRGTGPESKSSLQLATHRKGNHIQAKWIGSKWYGLKNARKCIKVSISRSKGELTYTMAQLKVWCKDWEHSIVQETERKLTIIRKQCSLIVKAIISTRAAQAIADSNPIDHVDLEAFNEIPIVNS